MSETPLFKTPSELSNETFIFSNITCGALPAETLKTHVETDEIAEIIPYHV
jgi:hypothetical protein